MTDLFSHHVNLEIQTFRRYSDMAPLSRLLATPSRLGLRHAVTVPVRRFWALGLAAISCATLT